METTSINTPFGWVSTNIGEVSEIISGSGFPKVYQGKICGEYPFAKVGDISKIFRAGKKYIQSARHYISNDVRLKIKGKIFPKYTIVFPKIGEALKGNYRVITRHLMLFDNNVMGVVPAEDMNSDFLYYFLLTKDFGKLSVATTVPSVRRGDVAAISLSLPPIGEQHRIVAKIEELFSELDKGIESLKTAREQLNVYRHALLKLAFEGKLTEQWRKDNEDDVQGCTSAASAGRAGAAKLETADQLLARIQREREARYQKQLDEWKEVVRKWEAGGKGKKPIKPRAVKALDRLTNDEIKKKPKIPELWSWVKIGDVSSVGTGVTPLKSRTDFYNDGEISWVTSGALNKPYITEASNYVTDLALSETNLRLYPAHTLLLAMYGEGKTRGKVSELQIPATTNQAIAAIAQQGLEENIRPYLKWFLRKNYTDIRRKSSGGVQPNLNLGIVENTVFPMCSVVEMEKIVGVLDQKLSIVEEIDSDIDLQLIKSEALRQSILKKAFSGKLVPQDPNDEPASELLKRIAAEKAGIEARAKAARAAAKKPMKKTRTGSR